MPPTGVASGVDVGVGAGLATGIGGGVAVSCGVDVGTTAELQAVRATVTRTEAICIERPATRAFW